jgi:hypothetical protein
VSAFDRSSALLASQNDLAPTISQHGVLRDLLLSVVRVEHDDMAPPVWIVAAADGSSRVTAGHRIHGISAADVVYRLPADERAQRGLLGAIAAISGRPDEQLTAAEIARARALVAPATIVLRFRPDDSSPLRYDRAVRFIVGITHVEPPRPWGPASENDALADAVIEEFRDTGRASSVEGAWFAATLTPDRAREEGFDQHPDSRVAAIAARFLSASNQRSFRRGVLRITANKRVSRELKVRIVTEMAVRPWRSTQTDPEKVNGVRAALHRTLDLPAVKDDGWRRDTDDPDRLLAAALAELEAAGGTGPASVELAVRGGYYLAVHGALRRESASRSQDFRAPSSVLQRMLESERGLRTLHTAIIDGRGGRRPTRVDTGGAPERGPAESPLLVDDAWLRRTFPAAGTQVAVPPIEGKVDTPESRFERERQRVVGLVDSLDSALKSAEAIQGLSRALVRERGWPSSEAEDLAERLGRTAGRLRLWATVAKEAEEFEDTTHEALAADEGNLS